MCEPFGGCSRLVVPGVGAPSSLDGKDRGTWFMSISKCISLPLGALRFLFSPSREGRCLVSGGGGGFVGGATTGGLHAFRVSVVSWLCAPILFTDPYLGVGSHTAPLTTHGPIRIGQCVARGAICDPTLRYGLH